MRRKLCDIKIEVIYTPQDKSVESLIIVQVVSGVEMAWIWFGLLYGTAGTSILMLREKYKRQKPLVWEYRCKNAGTDQLVRAMKWL